MGNDVISAACWFCYWGWPKPIHDIYKRTIGYDYGIERAMRWGPGHIVWEDENFGCAADMLNEPKWWTGYDDFDQDEIDAVRQSFIELAALPEEMLLGPKAFRESDEQSPENFPPPPDWEMVRV